jgi:hypothetical protein
VDVLTLRHALPRRHVLGIAVALEQRDAIEMFARARAARRPAMLPPMTTP